MTRHESLRGFGQEFLTVVLSHIQTVSCFPTTAAAQRTFGCTQKKKELSSFKERTSFPLNLTTKERREQSQNSRVQNFFVQSICLIDKPFYFPSGPLMERLWKVGNQVILYLIKWRFFYF